MDKTTTVSKVELTIDSNIKFEITDSEILIYNVPITGEIVQQYADGAAYKPLEEIQKIDVANTPIAFLHPTKSFEEMSTKEKAAESIGFLSKPTFDEKHPDKLYSDLIIKRSEDTKHLEEKLEAGEGVDVSIGFKYEKEEASGSFLGKAFDYVQRNIKLDHLAILLDKFGQVHPGRAPFPFYGIGADKADLKMAEDKNIQLEKDHALLQKDHADLTKEVEALKSEKATDADTISKLEADKNDLSEKLKSATDSLKVFQDKEKEAVDSMRNELSEKMPSMKAVFDSADSEAIKSAHADMKSKEAKSLDGAEGEEESQDYDSEALNSQFRNVKKQGDKN